jgi:hypothetical protein
VSAITADIRVNETALGELSPIAQLAIVFVTRRRKGPVSRAFPRVAEAGFEPATSG